MKHLATLCSLTLLAACAVPKPDVPEFSMAGTPPSINAVNVSDLSSDIVPQVLSKFGPKEGAIRLAGDNPMLSQDLARALKANGFRVSDNYTKHTVVYAITQVGPALLVTMKIDGQRSARLYRAGSAGEIVPATPLTSIEG